MHPIQDWFSYCVIESFWHTIAFSIDVFNISMYSVNQDDANNSNSSLCKIFNSSMVGGKNAKIFLQRNVPFYSQLLGADAHVGGGQPIKASEQWPHVDLRDSSVFIKTSRAHWRSASAIAFLFWEYLYCRYKEQWINKANSKEKLNIWRGWGDVRSFLLYLELCHLRSDTQPPNQVSLRITDSQMTHFRICRWMRQISKHRAQ